MSSQLITYVGLALAVAAFLHRAGVVVPVLSPLFNLITGFKLKPEDKVTGRPILDLVLHAALEKYATNPLMVELIKSLGKTVDKMMDDAGIPELPDLTDPSPQPPTPPAP